MGCSNMFSDLADFSGITQSNPTELRVTSVLHKACVDVNKNGTTADVYSGKKNYNYKSVSLDFIKST